MKKGLLFCVLLLNTLLIHAQAPQFFNAFPAVAGTVLNNYPLGSTLSIRLNGYLALMNLMPVALV